MRNAGPTASDKVFSRYKPWFYAAAVYNLCWGSVTILFPLAWFRLLGMQPPDYLPIWQAVGMLLLVYAPAYWWVARRPADHPHLVLVGLLGKVLGPIGVGWSVLQGELPFQFVLVTLMNDLIWLPAFVLYMRDAIRAHGLLPLLRGERCESASDYAIERPVGDESGRTGTA